MYNALKFTDPEAVLASTMVKVLTDDDIVYGVRPTPPSYFHVIEKSMYNAISEEMLDFFAGVIDFNNLIGEPYNRYRERYKALEKLRQTFFRRVTTVSSVEKFIEYYKWFDDALSLIISQLLPASAEFVENVSDVIESHVLERNKYKTPFPTINFIDLDIEGVIEGISEADVIEEEVEEGSSPNPTNTRLFWWQNRANRETTSEIATPDSDINKARNVIRDVVQWHNDNDPQTLTTSDGTPYKRTNYYTKFYSRPYKLSVALEKAAPEKSKKTEVTPSKKIKGGVNFDSPTPRLEYFYNATRPAGPVNKDNDVFVPTNVLLAPVAGWNQYTEYQDNYANFLPYFKEKVHFNVYYGPDYQSGYGPNNAKSTLAFPFNIVREQYAPTTGYNQRIVTEVSAGCSLVNLHHDTYGEEMETPMQGPFTDAVVGGHQSRHIKLNAGTDNYLNRPEAWKILLGTCTTIKGVAGAIGVVGADYPWPEANAVGANPYPMTGAQKAVYYRGFVAKRPVNTRNIQITTASALGNYRHNYNVVSTYGAYSNPQQFIKNQPTLPTQITQTPSASQARSYLDIRRNAEGHFQFVPDYSIAYLRAATGKSVIINRFSSPGGVQTMGLGYKDIRSGEYSIYSGCNYRYWSVIRPFQPISSSSEPTGSGTPGIRVSDIHGKDYGLRGHLTRHAGRFGRDSMLVPNAIAGATYDQAPAYNKINRNPLPQLVSGAAGYVTSAQYDNFWIQHQIPRSDRQYNWITESMVPSYDLRYYGYAKMTGLNQGYYSSSEDGYTAFFNFMSASSVLGKTGTASLYQPANYENIYVVDPINITSNTIGLSLASHVAGYYNTTLLDLYNIRDDLNLNADYLNLLLTQRRSTFNARRTPGLSTLQGRIITQQQKNSKMTLTTNGSTVETYAFKPPTMRGQIAYINMDINKTNGTYCFTWNNELLYCSDQTLNEILGVPEKQKDKTLLFEQTLTLANVSDKYKLNWVLYSERMFPSRVNEFTTTVAERPNFDNRMWRRLCADRQIVQNTIIKTNSCGIEASGTSWPMDAPCNFLDRTEILLIKLASNDYLEDFNQAGELQSGYFHLMCGIGWPGTPGGNFAAAPYRARNLAASGLYARKHMLPSAQSSVTPTIPNNQTGTVPPVNEINDRLLANMGAGEALWEAGTNAGIVVANSAVTPATYTFSSHSSAPWRYNSYADFIEEVRTKGKDFSIIPSFRISEHCESYMKNGLYQNNKFDWASIPGAYTNSGLPVNSSQSEFYKTYSNSEVAHHFNKVKEMSTLEPEEIMIEIEAVIKYNPDKKFYHQIYSLDLISQFSRSYSSDITPFNGNIAIDDRDGVLRPAWQPLFAPGIMYNVFKAGIAVDYPVVDDPTKIARQYFGATLKPDSNTFCLNGTHPTTSPKVGNVDLEGYTSGTFWDKRLPFETIIDPRVDCSGRTFYDMEPHPSASLTKFSCSFGQLTDEVYPAKASNFFGGIADFYLKNSTFSKLESDPVGNKLRFKGGEVYASRITLRMSKQGLKTYSQEKGSTGDPSPYSRFGGRVYDRDNNQWLGASYPLPQDPINLPVETYRENFIMYSRPTAFGPPVAGRPEKLIGIHTSSAVMARDSINGINASYTEPCRDGEAWADIIFRPGKYTPATEPYDLSRVLGECDVIYWRFDPGPNLDVVPALSSSTQMKGTPLIATFSDNIQSVTPIICEGRYINGNVMQLSASINLFGIENVYQDGPGAVTNQPAAQKWVISPKMETPILNFSTGRSAGAQDPTWPTYGSGSTARGMGHQFGIIEPDRTKGMFLECGNIPTRWLKNHYSVISESSPLNNDDVDANGARAYQTVKPLTDIVNFPTAQRSARLGELADSNTIQEAVCVIPYKLVAPDSDASLNAVGGQNTKSQAQETKRFFGINRERIEAALKESEGTKKGDSMDLAGMDIRTQCAMMQKYILPPQLDFIANKTIKPFACFFTEFGMFFDKDDLNYMYQGLAPRNSELMTFSKQSVAIKLGKNSLLTKEDVLDPELRWMVFKVKQRSMAKYEDLIPSQVGSSTKNLPSSQDNKNINAAGTSKNNSSRDKAKDNYQLGFNWPYDYLSIVETIKMDVKVLYKGGDGPTFAGADKKQASTAAAGDGISPELYNVLWDPGESQH